MTMHNINEIETSASADAPEKPVNDMSIVLVCWNNKAYLDPCLKSLYEGGLRSTFDVIVVDNGSTDGSQEMLREKYPDVKIIENGRNLGLSKASNQGIEATDGKYVLLLNNDTLVNADALDSMVDYLNAHPEAGAVGGTLLNEDGTFQAGYADFSTLKEEFLITSSIGWRKWKGYPSHKVSDEPVPVGWMSSACLLVRRETLNQIGLLDETYFIYGDEADLQYRINKAGWQVVYLPKIFTIHLGGRSMNRWRRRARVYRGKLLFYQKNYGPLRTAILRFMIGIMSAMKIVMWAFFALIFPKYREDCLNELRSNVEVVKLSIKLA